MLALGLVHSSCEQDGGQVPCPLASPAFRQLPLVAKNRPIWHFYEEPSQSLNIQAPEALLSFFGGLKPPAC
jgi:hypothetical protein